MRRLFCLVFLTAALAAHAQGKGDDDLGSAFGPPPPPKKYVPEHNVPAPKPPDDPLDEQRGQFARDYAAAQKALDKGDAAAVKDQLPMLEVNATLLGGPDRVKVAKLALAAGKKLGDKALQKESAEKWLFACGPLEVAACRTAALDALGAFDKAGAEKVKQADSCLTGAEAKPKAMPACLDAAAALYGKQQDTLMVARVELLRAWAIADAKKQKAALLKLAQQTEDRCAMVRRQALETVSRLELAAGDAEAAARAAIQASGAWGAALPPEKKFWSRVPAQDAACAAYEKTKGVHACHKLEKKTLGDFVFRDFSLETSGDQLTKEWMTQVNEHFNVLIQDCLDKEIRRLGKSNNAVLYRIKWLVLDDGSVDAVHSESSDYETAPFVQCIRTQFGYWKYPRHENNDPQQVVQGFTVKSSMRVSEETED